MIFSQMVDDPSEHTELLLSDPAKNAGPPGNSPSGATPGTSARPDMGRRPRGAAGGPDPGPSLPRRMRGRHRAGAAVRDHPAARAVGEHDHERCSSRPATKSGRAGATPRGERRPPACPGAFDRYNLPAFHDPFAGGGALPLEAQRLGLEAYASDLNPVAVLINKAMIEIPPKFAGRPPVNPESRKDQTLFKKEWRGAQGWPRMSLLWPWMRDEAEAHRPLVPEDRDHARDGEGTADLKPYEGQKLTVIAWLWARTVKSPNPAFAHVDVPLASTFMLSTKAGKEAYVEPVIEGGGYRFTVKVGKPKDPEAAKVGTEWKVAGTSTALCWACRCPLSFSRPKVRLAVWVLADGDRC